MSQTKKVDRERWTEFLDIFIDGNRGRIVALEVLDASAGDQALASASPLFGIDYDPAGKGDDLVISTGRDTVEFSHTIRAPEEIWELQDGDGKARALEFVDRNGTKTILTFQS